MTKSALRQFYELTRSGCTMQLVLQKFKKYNGKKVKIVILIFFY